MELSAATALAKRACAERGYSKDRFAAHFGAEAHGHGDAAMHEGYFARLSCVEAMVRDFVRRTRDAQIIVLGAGFDSLYWRLAQPNVGFFEVDSPAVVDEKRRIISMRPALKVEANYHLIACDLRDAAAVANALASAGCDSARPTLVLAECVLAYLPPDDGDALVRWAASAFQTGAFVAYDVLAPEDRFSRVMRDNFRARGWPLLGATRQTAKDQAARFVECGYAKAAASDMLDAYDAIVAPQERDRIRALRATPSDDVEQFVLIMRHYCLIVAARGDDAALSCVQALQSALDQPPMPAPASPPPRAGPSPRNAATPTTPV
ncbi:S-adenosyl-L-methionine-dependent methyltransferase [Pelagophyceae sp. CCMP2097]|nr:S-adenosyl-L-methionine-dependent methyltransferase [Pelagophyceae sp. CCMP2097]|mmetsp:Transcript_2961/g.8832  ORF Transcript_2961/g.8832 Transcript_2961/m.8832 type:complete len:321 (+) Transcript_2961:155-1117(+)